MAFYLNVSYLLTYLIIIYMYLLVTVSREQLMEHSWTSCSIVATKAARTVPCCCTWGHFECDGGGALPLCGISSWPDPGVPLPFTTLHCCCPLVSTDGMNIFLNFANGLFMKIGGHQMSLAGKR